MIEDTFYWFVHIFISCRLAIEYSLPVMFLPKMDVQRSHGNFSGRSTFFARKNRGRKLDKLKKIAIELQMTGIVVIHIFPVLKRKKKREQWSKITNKSNNTQYQIILLTWKANQSWRNSVVSMVTLPTNHLVRAGSCSIIKQEIMVVSHQGDL